jgi:hypothetical protein
MHPTEQIVARVRERARRYFPDIGEVADVSVLAADRRAYSDIYRLAICDGHRQAYGVVVKVFPAAEVQFHAMAAVWPRFASHPTWRIPRPLDCLEEGPALVMETVSGAPLNRALPRLAWAGRRIPAAALACGRAGQWLRFYHDLGLVEEAKTMDLQAKCDSLGESLDGLVGAGFDRARAREIHRRLAAMAEGLDGRAVRVSHVHGDFTVDNVLVDGPRITVLDLWAVSRSAVDHDIASFLNSLLLLRLTRPTPGAALGRLRQAFLDDYFAGEPYDDGLIRFLQAVGIADVALEILGRRRSALLRRWVLRGIALALEEIAWAKGSRTHVV